ncbi:MAG: penicillin-binding protein 1C [Pseudomonadota bacterium]
MTAPDKSTSTGKARRRGWRALCAGALVFGLAGISWAGFDYWVSTADVPSLTPQVSTTVLDRNGDLLMAYQVADGRWRLPIQVDQVDADYLAQLLAYEDGRFHRHNGVDFLAMARALVQTVQYGRPVSGASTLTMQVARLLRGQTTRTMGAKIDQIRLAFALERRLTKDQILQLYLTLAPFGGNIEGVRAAALTWFGKEPNRLTPAEAAMLVALPQSPEGRRPDRFADRAKAARDRVLTRAVIKGALHPTDADAARSEGIPTSRRAFPSHSPHLADRMRLTSPGARTLRVTIDRSLQKSIEALVQDTAHSFPSAMSAAVIVADHQTGEILASVGSPGRVDDARQGFLDMTRAIRSPGSTLKPVIYGLAFDEGLAHPESLVEDRPTSFAGYVPTNFDDGYHGTVSLRDALQRSLNVPAVLLLDAVGPAKLMARMRQAGAQPVLPAGLAPGLAIGLGGVGMSLTDLTQVYAVMARGGGTIQLTTDPTTVSTGGARLLGAQAAWQVADILAGVPAPLTASNGQLAFKTGTSYGYRDAWAIGFDGRHVIGVWAGRPDAAPVPGITGIKTAAPILFEAFARLKHRVDPLPVPPGGVIALSHADLPAPLKRVRSPHGRTRDKGPEIAFPPNGAKIATDGRDLALKVRNGRPPFTWLIDGQPIETMALARESAWRPSGSGFVAVSVIDATGAAAQTDVWID